MGALLLLAVISVLIMAERFGGVGADAFTPMGASTPGSNQEDIATRAGYATSEVFPLTLFAVLGMMVFLTANDLITMFVGLEVLSLPLYIMTGLARRRRLLSQEAALKYFLLGALLERVLPLRRRPALRLRRAPPTCARIAAAISTASGDLDGLLVPGVRAAARRPALQGRRRAVPLVDPRRLPGRARPRSPASWPPAPSSRPSACILRVAFVGVGASRWDWQGGVYVVAVLTMVVGAVLSVTQTDVKRLLAYSSIAHAGFILVGVLAFSQAAIGGVMFYLVAYGFATVAAFGLVAMVRQGGSEASHLSQWAGLGRNHPRVRRGVLVPAARVRRHPADLGLHGEVRRVRPGGRSPAPAARCSWSSRCSRRPSRRSSTSASSC